MKNLKLKKWFVSSFLLVLSFAQISQVTKAATGGGTATVKLESNTDGVQVQAKDSDVASQQPQDDKLENIAQAAEEKPISEEEAKKIERFRNFLINEEFAKYDYKNKNPDGQPKKTPFDPTPYEQDGDKLWEAVNDFIKKTGGPTANLEIFENEKKKFIEENGVMESLSRGDYVKKVGDAKNFIQLKRGMCAFEFVDSFKSGLFYSGGSDLGGYDLNRVVNAYGSGTYASTSVDAAKCYAIHRSSGKNEALGLCWDKAEFGAVVELGFDGDTAKIITDKELQNIKRAMVCKHPEMGGLYENFDRCYDYDFRSYKGVKNFHDIEFEKAFKQVFGFELKELVSRVKPDFKNLSEEEQEKIRNKIKSYKDFGLIYDFPAFSKVYDELMKQSTVKPHITDKYLSLFNDDGVLAKLLGYDAIVNKDDSKPDQKDFTYLIVNPKILTVCRDLDEEQFKKQEPTIENLKELILKD